MKDAWFGWDEHVPPKHNAYRVNVVAAPPKRYLIVESTADGFAHWLTAFNEAKHGRTEMAELPVLKVYGAVSLTFTVRGRTEGMLIDTHSGLPALQIPDNMEVGVRRAGDSVEVVTRPRVPS